MSKIKSAFEKGKALIVYLTCGDPDLKTTANTVRAAVKNGADLIVLGIPFSDPTAEPPVMQESNMRALRGGATVDKIFDAVKEFCGEVKVPIIFTAYANTVFSYGAEHFISTCKALDIDGLAVSDLPFEEKKEFLPLCDQYGVDLISSIAPAKEDRIAMIAGEARGFLHVVPSAGYVGDRSGIVTDTASLIKIAQRYTDLPCAVEADMPEAEREECAAIAQGEIFTAAVTRIIAEHGKDAPDYVGAYIKEVKETL